MRKGYPYIGTDGSVFYSLSGNEIAEARFDLSGPIETPEGRRSAEPTPIVARAEPQPAEAQPAPAEPVNGAGHPGTAEAEAPVELAEPQAQPVKRPRPRRRAKPAEAPEPEAAQQVD